MTESESGDSDLVVNATFLADLPLRLRGFSSDESESLAFLTYSFSKIIG